MQIQTDSQKFFFHTALIESGKSFESPKIAYETYLNRNESVYELEPDIKRQILENVLSIQWKNYPPPYYPDIEKLISDYCNVKPEQVTADAGSASIIAALINYFSINKRQIVIADPSFAFYSFHCNSYNAEFIPWPLNEFLEYDLKLLPELEPQSLVIFASPNNPVGNVIQIDLLETLLSENQNSLFLLDEVYNEFTDIQYTPLIEKYSNLILLRSFSKVFSSAGIRAGFMLADKSITDQVRKLILPFSLNHLTAEFLRYILSSPEIIKLQEEKNKLIINERQRVFTELNNADKGNVFLKVFPSEGNFLTLSFKKPDYYNLFKKNVEAEKVALLDVSTPPLLNLALRMTIGTPDENNKIINAITKTISLLG